MRIARYAIIYLAIILQFAGQCNTYAQDSPQASYVPPWQLKGLKSVFLVVVVLPWDIPKSSEIGDKIERFANKLLQKAGLVTGGDEQGAVLSIVVSADKIEEKALQGRLIIQVRTELSEEATFKRDPTLDNPHGFTTWDYDSVELVRLNDLESRILKEAKYQVEEFCSDWQMIKELTSKKLGQKIEGWGETL